MCTPAAATAAPRTRSSGGIEQYLRGCKSSIEKTAVACEDHEECEKQEVGECQSSTCSEQHTTQTTLSGQGVGNGELKE